MTMLLLVARKPNMPLRVCIGIESGVPNWNGTSLWKTNIYLKQPSKIKKDEHRENNLGEPVRYFGDLTYTFGVEDQYHYDDHLTFVPGVAYFYRFGIRAEDYDSFTGVVSDLPLADNGIFNFQLASYWNRFDDLQLSFVVASRSRLATLKDRYSYKIGRAIPNPSLKAEQSLNFDGSLKWHWKGILDLKSSIYVSLLNNTIQLVDQVEPGISQMQNTGEAIFYGMDLSLSIQWTRSILWRSNYAYIERENRSNPDLYFIDVPRHKVQSGLNLKIFDKLETNINYEYQSDRYSSSYGTEAASFHLFHLDVQTSIIPGLDMIGGIENVFDTYYERNEGYPGAGRSFFLRLKYRMES
jgi:iron complex outermembrane receptor protein